MIQTAESSSIVLESAVLDMKLMLLNLSVSILSLFSADSYVEYVFFSFVLGGCTVNVAKGEIFGTCSIVYS